ncbi:hypothetical protein DPMN_187597 [Dreissena polymorpha]|uniref:Uncharacterized protein n=1 Tax=Dreissena polymorpha TaxID=45954 RepID=A0A9D4DQW5_DREPO|nr:hypothetical protein DPMN_187597 [Dreissena polymorpha]
MELLVHNLLSLVIAAVAMTTLIRTSAVLVPSLDRVAPKYLKLACTSPSQMLNPRITYLGHHARRG